MSREGLNFFRFTENSEEYIESEKRHSDSENEAFGEYALRRTRRQIDRSEEEKGSPLTIEERESVLEETLGLEKDIILRITETEAEGTELSKQQKAVRRFLEKAVEDEWVRDQILEALDCTSDQLSIDKIAVGLRNGKITFRLFQEMLMVHTAEFNKKAEEIELAAEQCKQDFYEAAKKAIEDGYLPISLERLDSRLKNQRFRIFDSIEKSHLGEQNRGGVINLNVDIDPEEIRHTVFHELVHLLAGKSIAGYKTKGIQTIHEQKHGLQIRLDFPDQPTITGRYNFLNEAVTDEMAINLLENGDYERDGYKFERMVLKKLIDAGVSEDLFKNAYFENYDPKAKPGQRMPAWHELSSKINEVGKEKGFNMKKLFNLK